jgi:hypothetical protein
VKYAINDILFCLHREIRGKLKEDIQKFKENAPNFLPGLAIVQVE